MKAFFEFLLLWGFSAGYLWCTARIPHENIIMGGMFAALIMMFFRDWLKNKD